MFQRQITIENNVNVINASLDVCCCVDFCAFFMFSFYQTTMYAANNCKFLIQFVKTM